jgi:hypothetical protein
MSKLKYSIYQAAGFLLPQKTIKRFASSSVTRAVRDRFLRPNGSAETVGGVVHWEDLEFYYTAPYKCFHQAQTSGIENSICRLARATLREGGSGIDVGTNYGFVSLVMAKSVVQPRQADGLAPVVGGQVFSFEIEPGICEVISGTIKRNNLSDIVTLIPNGVGAENRDGLVTIDSIVEQHNIERLSFIKIDVDGGDFDVLDGARKTLRKHLPVIVVEMGARQREIYDLLCSLGYTYFIDQNNKPVTPDEWPLNLIATTLPVNIPEPASS